MSPCNEFPIGIRQIQILEGRFHLCEVKDQLRVANLEVVAKLGFAVKDNAEHFPVYPRDKARTARHDNSIARFFLS